MVRVPARHSTAADGVEAEQELQRALPGEDPSLDDARRRDGTVLRTLAPGKPGAEPHAPELVARRPVEGDDMVVGRAGEGPDDAPARGHYSRVPRAEVTLPAAAQPEGFREDVRLADRAVLVGAAQLGPVLGAEGCASEE